MAKKFEELTISDDFMFGIIMRDPRYCKPFLERVLSISIDHIEYPKIQETIDIDVEAKSIRLDVYVDDGSNTVYNIEMQNSNNKNLPMRMRYYQDVIDLNLLDKGQNYDELKTNLVIFVCTFDPFGLGRHFYSFENICIEDHDLSLNDGTKKIMLNTKGILDDISPELKRLLDFIDGEKPGDDFTRDLDIAVKNARLNTKWRVEYMNLQLAFQEKYREGLKVGEKRGEERGLKLGEERGLKLGELAEKKETARRMLSDGKLSIEEVSLYSGLSVEEIKDLKI